MRLKNLLFIFVLVGAAACGDGSNNDNDSNPVESGTPTPTVTATPNPQPTPIVPCASTDSVCVEEECQPIVDCDEGCEAKDGIDPTGEPYSSLCSSTLTGQSPDPEGTGLFQRVVTNVSENCYTDDVFPDGLFRETGRCEHLFVAQYFELFCEGNETGGVECFPNTTPSRCRTVHIKLDGGTESSDVCS